MGTHGRQGVDIRAAWSVRVWRQVEWGPEVAARRRSFSLAQFQVLERETGGDGRTVDGDGRRLVELGIWIVFHRSLLL